jgi:lipoprotein-anchoring transpeptidase ErfK/SrfK
MVKRAGLLLMLFGTCALAGVLAAAVLADTPPPTDPGATASSTETTATIADGVVLGGVAVGGMPGDTAVQALQAQFARPVVLRLGHLTLRVAPAALGVAVPADAAVARALTVAPDTTLRLRASVDVPAVKAFVARLSHRYDRKPVDARLALRKLKPFVTKSKPGLVIEKGPTVAALRTALAQSTGDPVQVALRRPQASLTSQAIGPVIVIRRGSNVLNLYRGVKLVRQFHVATGQAIYPTPLGRFQIVVKWKNPWWYPPNDPWAAGEKPTPPGPGNPLGTRWMGLSSPGVGIHGTPESGSIGYSLSHGCIRMLIPQAEWLFDRVNVGTPVFIVAA